MRSWLDRFDIALSRRRARHLGGAGAGDSPEQARIRLTMARRMCEPCAQRWVVGRPVRHELCRTRLRAAIDEYLERLREG